MDDELQQLEAELKRLRPVAPPSRLIARVARELAASRAHGAGAITYWLWATVVPAAAALTILLAQSSPQPRSTMAKTRDASAEASGAVFKPVAAQNILVAAQDEGLVTLEDGTTARRARLKYVDTITWKNPHTNASLTWTVPREEIRVMPVVFQ